jgi:polysaccharide transporter, PST family
VRKDDSRIAVDAVSVRTAMAKRAGQEAAPFGIGRVIGERVDAGNSTHPSRECSTASIDTPRGGPRHSSAMLRPGPRLWVDRSFRLLASAGSPILTAVAGVLRNKWLAIHLDVSGIGILAHVVSVQTWLGIASGLGLGFPLASAVASAEGRGDEGAARRSFWTALSLATIAGLSAAALALLFAPLLSSALLGSPEHAGLVRISAFGVVAIALSNTLQGLLAGRSDLRGPIAFSAIGGLCGVAATVLLVPRWGLSGATLAITLLYVGGLLGVVLARRRAHRALLAPPPSLFDSREAGALLSVGTAALVLSLFDLGVMIAIRAHYLREHGTASNGLLQAALALSQQVGAVFYSYLTAYAFGRVSASGAIGGIAAVERYTRRQWKPLMLAAAAFVAFAIVAAAPLLHLLYSSRFDPARPLMAFALFGEFCRISAQSWSVGALPVGGRALWLRIGLSQPLGVGAAYIAWSAIGVGALALPLAYATGGLITLVAAIAGMWKSGIVPRAGDMAWLLVALVALGLLVAWSNRT